MVQYAQTRYDATFAALSDATRRGVVEALMRQDASISDLAQRFDMTLTGMKKHVGLRAGCAGQGNLGRGCRFCPLGDVSTCGHFRKLFQINDLAFFVNRVERFQSRRSKPDCMKKGRFGS